MDSSVEVHPWKQKWYGGPVSCSRLMEIGINCDIKPIALCNDIFTITNTEFNDSFNIYVLGKLL
jgi:hypothetical protein